MDDASTAPLVQKLGIRESTRMTVVNPPPGFRESLGDLPLAVEWANRVRPPLDLVVAFHTRRADVMARWRSLAQAMATGGAVWIAWPKTSSGVSTDLTADVLRTELIKMGWVDTEVCAIDDTWSALRFVARRDRRERRVAPRAAPAKLRRPRPGSHR